MMLERQAGDMEQTRNTCRILVGKPKGRSLLENPRCRWEDIRIHVRGIGWEGVDWMHLVHYMDQWRAVVNTVMNLRVPQKAGK
jgi:hypothetical protein